MTIQSIASAHLPLMVAAGTAVGLAAVMIVGPEVGAVGLVVLVAARSLMVLLEGVVLLGLVHHAGRQA